MNFSHFTRTYIIAFFSIAVILSVVSCIDSRTERFVESMDSLYQVEPYAAIDSIDSLMAQHGNMSRRNRMTLCLYRMRAQNSANIPFTSDSLARVLVDYFEDYGTVDERMSAKYVLGSVSRDLGDYPSALSMYQQALLLSAGAVTERNYRLVYSIYGQKANILYSQLAYNESADAYRQAEQIAYAYKDTLYALLAKEQICNILDLQKRYDDACRQRFLLAGRYEKMGYKNLSVRCLLPNADVMITKRKLRDAYIILKEYQCFSGDIDSIGNVAEGREYYYIVSANFYAAMKNYAKASVFYRKYLASTHGYSEKECSYKGLTSIYCKQNKLDSVAKYAELARIANDSLFLNMSTLNMQRMNAAYNFKAKELSETRAKIQLEKSRMLLLAVLIAFAFTVLLMAYCQNKSKAKREIQWLMRQKQMDEMAIDIEQKRVEIAALLNIKNELTAMMENKNSEISKLVDERQILIDAIKERIAEKHKESKMSEVEKDKAEFIGIVEKFKEMANVDYKCPTFEDWSLLDKYIVAFHYPVFMLQKKMTNIEYNVSTLVRLGFKPSEICILTGLSNSNVSNIRKRLFEKIHGKTGSAKEFDEYVKSLK